MNIKDIEHAWKVASNDPHHDTNWYDPVVVEFARMIQKKTCEELAKKIQAMPFGDTGASFAQWIRAQHDIDACSSDPKPLRARS